MVQRRKNELGDRRDPRYFREDRRIPLGQRNEKAWRRKPYHSSGLRITGRFHSPVNLRRYQITLQRASQREEFARRALRDQPVRRTSPAGLMFTCIPALRLPDRSLEEQELGVSQRYNQEFAAVERGRPRDFL